jgi:hypothetical protein
MWLRGIITSMTFVMATNGMYIEDPPENGIGLILVFGTDPSKGISQGVM